MNAKKLQSVLEFYEEELTKKGHKAEQLSEEEYKLIIRDWPLFHHCLWMIQEMKEPTKTPDIMEKLKGILPPEIFEELKEFTKKNRWLGFVQGCFAQGGMYNIDELRQHSRSS